MKKTVSLMLALMMLLCFTAFAEEAAGIPNPMVETDEAGIREHLGLSFGIPDGAVDCKWFIISDHIAELQCVLEQGAQCTVRMSDEAEWTDISGCYYEWTYEDDEDTVNGREAKTMRYVGDEGMVDVCLWFDAAPGAMYCVIVEDNDLDGFDVLAIAEQAFIPMQGDC